MLIRLSRQILSLLGSLTWETNVLQCFCHNTFACRYTLCRDQHLASRVFFGAAPPKFCPMNLFPRIDRQQMFFRWFDSLSSSGFSRRHRPGLLKGAAGYTLLATWRSSLIPITKPLCVSFFCIVIRPSHLSQPLTPVPLPCKGCFTYRLGWAYISGHSRKPFEICEQLIYESHITYIEF